MSLIRLMLIPALLFSVVFTGTAGLRGNGTGQKGIREATAGRSMKSSASARIVPGKVIVKLRQAAPLLTKISSTFGITSIDAVAGRYGVASVQSRFPDSKGQKRGIDLSKILVMTYTKPFDAWSVAQALSELPEVEYAEPWFVYTVGDITLCTPDDSYRADYQWPLTRILADSAWCISKGDTSIVIGIDDTGVQWDHPDLAPNIWINPGEWGPDGHGGRKESNNIDDDGDGMIDDWHGWDFGGADYLNPVGDNDPGPKSVGSTHGTHVAGIASAATNNQIGMAGVGYKCKILPIKTSSDNDTRFDGTPGIVFGFDAMIYAAILGADVVNCSWGGPGGYSRFEQEVIDSVTAHGVIVVAAAGNDGKSTLFYPASYRHVVSVGATDFYDVRPYYSQFNEDIDVMAPGDVIFSTYYPSTYTWMSGTSMAAPHVSGLAGLVKSVFPLFTPDQIGEQIRVNADDITALNPAYAGMLGHGRINAFNALTRSTPAIRMNTWEVRDSAGLKTAIAQSGHSYTLLMTFENYLQPVGPASTVTLTTSDTAHVEIVNGSFALGSLGTFDTVSNQLSPFRITVKQATPGYAVPFNLRFTDGGSYTDNQTIVLAINPVYATHTVNNIQVTLTNIGRIGHPDLTNTAGDGFRFNYIDELYEGGLLIGTSSVKTEDVVRNADGGANQDADFASDGIYTIIQPGPMAAQEGSASFIDSTAPAANRIGLRIAMHSYAFDTPADSNYVIVQYDLINISGSDISNLYAGLFFDWDMQPDVLSNKTSFDSLRSLGYAWDILQPSPIYCGAAALQGPVGYRGIMNVNPDLSRSGKWAWLSGGVVRNDSVNDIHFTISSGPISIPANGRTTLAFSLCAGNGLTGIQSAADAAQAKWDAIKGIVGVQGPGPERPVSFALLQNYPNPFNPSTNVTYSVGTESAVKLRIYDLLGREVAMLDDGIRQRGTYSVSWDAAANPSGVYFYRLDAVATDARSGRYSAVRKMLFIR